ncbi:MAG: ABC transporter permease subunit [Christensenellales bacterium]
MNKRSISSAIGGHLKDYIVTYLFLAISVFFIIRSGLRPDYILSQLVDRMTRNAFIVLALMIPIIAGMGINFAITIGAMAAQIGLVLVLSWEIPGIAGVLIAAAITVPLAGGFGLLIGMLLNRMKGQETIGSLILGYFANGAYQLLFLFIFGRYIPLSSAVTIMGATGVQNTLSLMGENGLYKAIDRLWRLPFGTTLYVFAAVILVGAIVLFALKKMRLSKFLVLAIPSALSVVIYNVPIVKAQFVNISVPIITFAIVGVLCLFNVVIMRTRLGQKFRAVGQNRVVANAAGINVNRVRLIAITISTILAGWGQIIFIQNLGTLQTYAAHEMVGLYAGAAILVGGASIDRATNSQALVGCVLFHTLFIVAQNAASNIFGDAAIGEYFRVFLCYGVIALALVMYAWRSTTANKNPARAIAAAGAKAR